MKKVKRKESNGRIRRILLSAQFCITVLVIMGLLAFICLVRVVLGFMPVKHFALEGNTHYDISEVISASGIRSGDKLYGINEKKATEKLIAECPYIKTVKIKQKFPTTVCFVVEDREPGWYIQVGKNFYGLDFDMRVLQETYVDKELIERGLTKLVLPELEIVFVGELPNFASGDDQLKRETLEIIESFRSHEIKARLTGLDVSNRFEIKLQIDNSYEVYFGDIKNFDIKMEFLTEVLKKAEESGYSGGTITWDEGYSSFGFKGVYADPSESESETVKESDIID